MKNCIVKLLRNTWGLLIFALLSGTAYYVVVLKFILSHTSAGGGLLGFFFLPAIVCGAALVLIKVIKQCFENDRDGAAAALFVMHIILILLAVVFAVSMI